jgi:hypothetical protein
MCLQIATGLAHLHLEIIGTQVGFLTFLDDVTQLPDPYVSLRIPIRTIWSGLRILIRIQSGQWIRIRIGIEPKMLDPDPDEMNADPQPCIWLWIGIPIRILLFSSVAFRPTKKKVLSKDFLLFAYRIYTYQSSKITRYFITFSPISFCQIDLLDLLKSVFDSSYNKIFEIYKSGIQWTSVVDPLGPVSCWIRSGIIFAGPDLMADPVLSSSFIYT